MEHEVSIGSARSASQTLSELAQTSFWYIAKDGGWSFGNNVDEAVATPIIEDNGPDLAGLSRLVQDIDFFFPLVHGADGEDGRLQGMLELVGARYVGSGPLGATVCLDKAMAKTLASAWKVKTVPFILASRQMRPTYAECKEAFGGRLIVKPNALGSSIGVSLVDSPKNFESAVDSALDLDNRAIIEPALNIVDLSCGVVGSEKPISSEIGQIDTVGIYTYEKKYTDEDVYIIPARIPSVLVEQIRQQSILLFQKFRLLDLARVDWFYDELNGNLYFNEMNTTPCLDSTALFPQLFEAVGLKKNELYLRVMARFIK